MLRTNNFPCRSSRLLAQTYQRYEEQCSPEHSALLPSVSGLSWKAAELLQRHIPTSEVGMICPGHVLAAHTNIQRREDYKNKGLCTARFLRLGSKEQVLSDVSSHSSGAIVSFAARAGYLCPHHQSLQLGQPVWAEKPSSSPPQNCSNSFLPLPPFLLPFP